MSETADWKQKYRDSLLEMESEEKRWRKLEQSLRRLVGRLCAAGMGVEPALDDRLIALAAANRRNADANELEDLAVSLTSAVIAVDAVSPVPSVVLPILSPWDLTCAAVGKVLNSLGCVTLEGATKTKLLTELAAAKTDAKLASILERVADWILAYSESIAKERMQAAAALADVTRRLDEMAGYLSISGDASRSHFTDTASINDTVMIQVREMTVEVVSATELQALQTAVTARLETITRHVLDFKQREQSRLLEHTGRAERMRARISNLEREAEDLNSKLDQEKHDARLDPLTLLANRKSFDERLAQVIEKQATTNLPVTMLLWDLDNFKFINDSYGHRAGDRVLQSVANCFSSGLRGEDFVARIGGEEFVVLLTGLPCEGSLRVANELRKGVEALRLHFRGTPVRVTISCGLTELHAGDAAGAAFDRADAALYRAKHAGKNLCIAA